MRTLVRSWRKRGLKGTEETIMLWLDSGSVLTTPDLRALAPDGVEAMERLVEKGLAKVVRPGVWGRA